MSLTPHASSSPTLIVIGRSVAGQPRTYRVPRRGAAARSLRCTGTWPVHSSASCPRIVTTDHHYHKSGEVP